MSGKCVDDEHVGVETHNPSQVKKSCKSTRINDGRKGGNKTCKAPTVVEWGDKSLACDPGPFGQEEKIKKSEEMKIKVYVRR